MRREPSTHTCAGRARSGRRHRARGYLMLEVVISAAILAVVLGAAVNVIAKERAGIARAGHRAKASSLAQELMSQLLADNGPSPTYACGSNVTVAVDTSHYPGFARRYSCTLVSNAVNGGLGSLYELTVEVDYPLGTGALHTIRHKALRRDRHALLD